MIRRMRSSAPARAALCAAALLSIVAAFGLHPEPAGGLPVAATAALASRATLGSASHGCIACLNGGSAVVSAPAGIAPATDSAEAVRSEPYTPPDRSFRLELSGRSPPAGLSA